MQRLLLFCTALFFWLLLTPPSFAGVSISIGEPGFYGRIDIGGYPAPRLVFAEPIIAQRVRTWHPPVYLRVPPGHIKQWYRYCDRYQACGRPVYFIDDGWYRNTYAPNYRKRNNHHRRHQVVEPPEYYEYKRYKHRPPERVYPRRQYDEEYPRHRDGRHR